MNLADQLRRDEGVRNKPYLDTVGKVTIGVGRNLTDVGLSDAEVEMLLQADIARVREQLEPYGWYTQLDEVRRAAVENMCFNLGLNGLLHFPHMIVALAKSEWSVAASEALASKWATQVGQRAHRIANQLETGQWT